MFQLRLDGPDREFRDELRSWLADNLIGDFAEHRGVGEVANDSFWDLRIEWEKRLTADRWLNITWPVMLCTPRRPRRRPGCRLGSARRWWWSLR